MEVPQKSDVRPGYPDPVGLLLTIGEPPSYDPAEWPDYVAVYGLAPEHIPELIRLACDAALSQGKLDGSLVWAPTHAWRALGQMQAEASVLPLLAFLKAVPADDSVIEEFPVVFGMVGSPAISPIAGFLSDATLPVTSAAAAMDGLKEIAERHPASRGDCVGILVEVLDKDVHPDKAINGFAVSTLLDMAAVETIEAIREAFRQNKVDVSICGDIEDVELHFGLRERRTTPAPRYHTLPVAAMARPAAPPVRQVSQAPGPAKVGRNDPCPCGSGKKYKKCCLH